MDSIHNKRHFVYSLIKNKKPIYIGCCVDVKKRENAHRQLKDFDYVFIIKEYSDKKSALIAENAIIRFLSILNDDNIQNVLFSDLTSIKEIKDTSYGKR